MASYRRSQVLRIEVDPVLYVWTGHGPLDTPVDAVDPAGARWLGAGHLIDLPSQKVLLNGGADRVDIRVSGVDAEAMRLATEDREEVPESSVLIGDVNFDADWQLEGPINWKWRGTADVLVTAGQATEQGRQRTITLSVRSGDTRRSNPRPAFFTHADQRRRSNDDDIFDHVAQINGGITRRFGAL